MGERQNQINDYASDKEIFQNLFNNGYGFLKKASKSSSTFIFSAIVLEVSLKYHYT